MNEDKRTLYVVDEEGAISPEVERINQIYGINNAILQRSSAIGEALVNLRFMAHELAKEKEFDGGYRFACEPEAKEELLMIANYLDKLNMRIWAITRTLGTEAQALAEKIQVKDNQAFDKELDEFVKSTTLGQQP